MYKAPAHMSNIVLAATVLVSTGYTIGISVTYSAKSSGSRRDSWGTPKRIFLKSTPTLDK